MFRWLTCLALLLSLLFCPFAHAHPVPRSAHDRTLTVQVSAAGKERLAIQVQYRLEVDELTVVLDDMAPFSDQVDYARYREKRAEFYNEFTRIYAPILAGNLVVKVDGRPVDLQCSQRRQTLFDEQKKELGHLRCDFTFRADCPIPPGRPISFSFRESNYELQTGKIEVSLKAGPGIELKDAVQADAAVKKRSETEFLPGDEEKLRRVSATVLLPVEPAPKATTPDKSEPTPAAPPASRQPERKAQGPSLFALFVRSDYGLGILLLISFGIGAIHALTPGHGKTLVAAYLVGQHGTITHAIVLGLVTTFTHTGAVLLLAVGLAFMDEHSREYVQAGLGLVAGLLITSLGVWLLLTRLAGKADHIHIGGSHHHHGDHHHHHHHHGHADHAHDAEGHVIPLQQDRVTWWSLVVLGFSGGIIPCWDAVAMLILASGMGLFWLALPMLLSFSLGLAAVLVAFGILVVQVRGFATSRWGEGRIAKALPLISAVVIIVLGFWLGYESVHGRSH